MDISVEATVLRRCVVLANSEGMSCGREVAKGHVPSRSTCRVHVHPKDSYSSVTFQNDSFALVHSRVPSYCRTDGVCVSPEPGAISRGREGRGAENGSQLPCFED